MAEVRLSGTAGAKGGARHGPPLVRGNFDNIAWTLLGLPRESQNAHAHKVYRDLLIKYNIVSRGFRELRDMICDVLAEPASNPERVLAKLETLRANMPKDKGEGAEDGA